MSNKQHIQYNKYNIRKIISLIFINFVAVFYYFIKSSISNIKDFFINEDGMTASNFSDISSAFSISYSISQPLGGYLIDKYSFSLIYTLFFLLAVITTLIFTKSNTFITLLLIRYAMGFFFSIASTGSMKYLSFIWHQHFIFLMSIMKLLMNGGGAFASSNYIYKIMLKYGWRNVIFTISLIGLTIILLLSFSLFSHNKEFQKHQLLNNNTSNMENKFSLKESLINIYNTKGFLTISIFSIFTATGAYLLMDGWGNHLFNLQYSNNIKYISPATFSLIGTCIGHFLNIFSDKVSIKLQMFIYSSLGLIALLLIIYGPSNPYIFLFACFLIGINNAVQNLSFRWIQQNIQKEFLGFAFSIFNFICMFFGCALIQKSAGYILDFVKNKSIINTGIIYKGYMYKDIIILFKILLVPIIISYICILYINNNVKSKN